MAGLEKILAEINQQGGEQARAVISAAESKAEKIKADGRSEANDAYDEYIKSFKMKSAQDYASACAAADAESKRAMLRCKSECIDAAVNAALEKLASLDDKEYFELIVRLAAKNLRTGDGVIGFSDGDLKRLPSDLEARLNKAAAEKYPGSSVKISDTAEDIENGFVLSYGNITENCSFSAIMESEKDSVRDLAASILFAG